ncbi:MAG TPA: response regulator [Candidatus Acidoferrum sp.]|nr:response regulator [Candidatus Acidoferrum sp.]
MAKILVADDNSNIQKMVGLALKDQGIDVVAVGNGEAAVRKISDLKPDLVLADVFMPVRNGYEVCQYVKLDPSLAHIPVILLVGAFDPLDEQEAQRVGADGVLKKPFVPPDPLISMVKSALQRAGVAHGNVSAAKTPELEAIKGTDLLTPSSASMIGTPPPPMPSHAPTIAPLDQESFVDEAPARPEPVRIDSGSQTVAFGSLLETPVEEKEDDLAFLPPVNSELATDRDWRDPDTEETDEEEEEEKPAPAWRREDAESYAEAGGSTGGAKDWRAGSFEQIQAKKIPVESWEPVEEKPELVETAPAASVSEVPAAPVTIPETAPVTGAISTTPFASDAWAAVSSTAVQENTSSKTATAVEEVAHVKEPEPPAPVPAVTSAPEVKAAEPQTNTGKESWFSVPSNPWNAEIEKANKLASAWDAAVPVAAPPVSSNGTETPAEAVSEESQKVIEQAALPTAAVEAIREEAAHVAENAAQATEQQPSEGKSFYAPEALVETPAEAPTPAATPSMDDLVAKVLAKLSPDVLQAVTREILKPVVEAMVKEEMKSKKS